MTQNTNDAFLQSLKTEISAKRGKWREVREAKLQVKEELKNRGLAVEEIRKNKEYCRLKREQNKLSKEIKHLEKKYNRKLAAAAEC